MINHLKCDSHCKLIGKKKEAGKEIWKSRLKRKVKGRRTNRKAYCRRGKGRRKKGGTLGRKAV